MSDLIDDDTVNNVLAGLGGYKSKPVHNKQSVDKHGYVYLLAVHNSPGLYKIGRTFDLDDRIRTFNVKLPFPVEYEHTIKTDNCYALERTLHNLFKDQRVNGEFFTLSKVDVQFIKCLSGG